MIRGHNDSRVLESQPVNPLWEEGREQAVPGDEKPAVEVIDDRVGTRLEVLRDQNSSFNLM